MNVSKYSEETRKEVARLWDEGATIKKIAELVGVPCGSVARIARDMGCSPHRAPRGGKKKPICPKCKHKNPDGSNFCNKCGTDIRTKEDILLGKVSKLRGILMLIQNEADLKFADEVTLEIMGYLKEKRK